MEINIASVTISGLSAYSQSRKHDEPKKAGGKESPDAYDERTWRSHLTTETVKGKETVVIPAHGMHQALAAAAKYSKRKIVGQGKSTWTQKFNSGITIPQNPSLGIDPKEVIGQQFSCSSTGERGAGKRVTRWYPMIMPPWSSTFEVWILDREITQEIFKEMLEICGMFIGIGRFRPENGGYNGRFSVAKFSWAEDVDFALSARRAA